MEEKTCPACKAENDDDASYCDQCGQPLNAPENDAADDAGGACPACGGVVESRGDGKGVCASCGLELFETDDDEEPAAVDAGTVARLTAAIVRGANSGLPLERAVADGCREVFSEAAAPAASSVKEQAPAGKPLTCPLCGVEGPADSERCGGCGLWFGEPHGAHACPRCDREVRGGKCECGAILTLPKLLEYVEPAVRFVCSKCKAPYAVSQPKCPDCGGGLISAERIKAFAATADA
jgi:predicted amidophosphoribosyltransferase